MKSSAIKIVQAYFSKKNINNFKKLTNIRNVLIGLVALILIISTFYLIKPTYFNYALSKQTFEKKISNYFQTATKINGDISYYFFPRPKIVIKDLELDLSKKKEKKIIFKEAIFLLSISKLNNLDIFEIKKSYVSKQKIRVYPGEFRNYIEYFQNKNVKDFIIKDSELFFIDDQNNTISISNVNLKNTFDNNKEKISIKGVFSQKNFKFSFLNKKNDEKYLNFAIPEINSSLKIIFNQKSNLDKNSGKFNLKIIDNILMLNFEGNDEYKISNSFFRNKFLNSKINGKMNLKENFDFDLNLDINRINLSKLFSYYEIFSFNKSSKHLNLSKKINGKANVTINKTDSFVGRIENSNFNLFFENGNLKIRNGVAMLEKNGKLKFNFSLIGNGNNQRINFFINFSSEKGKKLLKKFNINSDEDNVGFNAIGRIEVINKKIKFDSLTLNKETLDSKSLKNMEEIFEQYVIQDNVLGFLDYFKVKKFVFESSKNF